MTFVRRLLFLAPAILFVPGFVQSCGPFLDFTRFTPYTGTLPGEFATGRLGVLQPHYYRADLLMAYRILSGVQLSPGESPNPLREAGPASDRARPWLLARNQVPGVSSMPYLDPDKKVSGNAYEMYPNCLTGAFVTAAETLTKRRNSWGAGSENLKEWVRGQDQVFQNCSGGPVIPAPLQSADKLLQADRAYQIAAAEFYSAQPQQAEEDFDRIAGDSSSPWRDTAAYVAARACIREATLGQKPDKLREAATRLIAITKDPSRAAMHASAEDLLNFVQARISPQTRLVALGDQIMQPRLGDQVARVITDYTQIWDHLEADSHQPALGTSDVSDWITIFQHGGNTVQKWRSKQSLPWLLASLVWAEKENATAADLKDLVEAAHALKSDSPGYATAVYYGVTIQIRQGELDAARQWADEALKQKENEAVVNLLRGERLSLARTWPEFLQFAPRIPVATGNDSDGTDSVLDDGDPHKAPAFDADATTFFNSTVPLKLWLDAAGNKLLPQNLQAKIAQAAWVRAVILRDHATARLLADRLRHVNPALQSEMDGYLAEKDPAFANFNAVFLMLREPGFEPFLRTGWGRATPVQQRDILRDNWWTLGGRNLAPAPPPLATRIVIQEIPGVTGTPQASKENEQLSERAENGVNYLCSEALTWANLHPQDSRVPYALFLAVEATHYGPSDKSTTALSKRAFLLLHNRYPNSEWTAKTKYWY